MPTTTWRERVSDFVADRTGIAVTSNDRLELLEASDRERRALQRELDLLAYTALDYVGAAPQELKAVERRKLAQKSRIVWMRDPMAGAGVDLMNDFTFGRGLAKPKANDKAVQDAIDEAWDDDDNKEVLTTLDAQVRLGTDLSLTSNIFIKVFDDGEDGKVKLSLLKNDLVEGVVRDPENWQRVLWFVASEEPYTDWDYVNDQPLVELRRDRIQQKVYYPHWRNIDLLLEEVERGVRTLPNMPPAEKIGEGKIFHIAINRTTDMALGHPTMDRLLRWYSAYNRFMDARVDLVEASAAFFMKRKVKGTPNQLNKMATQALSRRSSLGSAQPADPELTAGPRTASVLVENEGVDHEPLKIPTGGAEAAQDGALLRAPISAATRFPQSYYGDASNSNLATATSLELPVLKAVESRQEKFESAVRFFIDRVIARAVDSGRISDQLSPEEIANIVAEKQGPEAQAADAAATPAPMALGEAHDDAVQDEIDTQRDLGYEFSMPSPLKRMMGDLVSAVADIARTFDPNNTNPELSRVLLLVTLSDGLELEDAAGMVDKIFPPGYEDPAIAAAQAQAQAMGAQPRGGQNPQFGEFGPPGATGADGDQHPADNAYGAKQRARPPEAVSEAGVTLGRGGGQVRWLAEARVQDLPEETRERIRRRTDDAVADLIPTPEAP